MARNANVTVGAEWVQLTVGDVTAIRVQNVGTHAVLLQATSGTSAPSSAAGAARLWAQCEGPHGSEVSVSHG